MRTRTSLALLLVALLVTVTGSAAGGAAKAQECDQPRPPTQSGRASITPGVNHLRRAQTVSLSISLFSCSPSSATRGAGTLKSTITIKTPQSCALLTRPHRLTAPASIRWKTGSSSNLALALTLSGASHDVTISGIVTRGLFKNHSVGGRFHFGEVVATKGSDPSSSDIVKACRNTAAPNQHGRLSINGLTFLTTKSFTVS